MYGTSDDPLDKENSRVNIEKKREIQSIVRNRTTISKMRNASGEKRIPLSVITQGARNIASVGRNDRIAKSKPAAKPKPNLKEMIKKLHRSQAVQTSETNSVPLSQVMASVDETNFTRAQRKGLHNKFHEINSKLLSILPETGDAMTEVNTQHVKSFVDWFKVNRYDYVLVEHNLNYMKQQIMDHLSSNNDMSIASTNTSGISNFSATHLVIESNQTSQFLVSVKLQSIETKTIGLALLAQTDVRMAISSQDLLSLQESAFTQHVLERRVPVYFKWKVLRDKPLDVDFFG